MSTFHVVIVVVFVMLWYNMFVRNICILNIKDDLAKDTETIRDMGYSREV